MERLSCELADVKLSCVVVGEWKLTLPGSKIGPQYIESQLLPGGSPMNDSGVMTMLNYSLNYHLAPEDSMNLASV